MAITSHRSLRRHFPIVQPREPFDRLIDDVNHILVIHVKRKLV
jgi:hypothetical protein